MSLFDYELLGVDVWLSPTGDWALVGACGVVERTEATQFATSDKTAATWSYLVAEGDEKMLLLALRGQSVLGTKELRFTVAPDEMLLQVLRLAEVLAEQHVAVPLAFFTRLVVMKDCVKRFARAPTDATLRRWFAKALYGGDFRVEPGLLRQFV